MTKTTKYEPPILHYYFVKTDKNEGWIASATDSLYYLVLHLENGYHDIKKIEKITEEQMNTLMPFSLNTEY